MKFTPFETHDLVRVEAIIDWLETRRDPYLWYMVVDGLGWDECFHRVRLWIAQQPDCELALAIHLAFILDAPHFCGSPKITDLHHTELEILSFISARAAAEGFPNGGMALPPYSSSPQDLLAKCQSAHDELREKSGEPSLDVPEALLTAVVKGPSLEELKKRNPSFAESWELVTVEQDGIYEWKSFKQEEESISKRLIDGFVKELLSGRESPQCGDTIEEIARHPEIHAKIARETTNTVREWFADQTKVGLALVAGWGNATRFVIEDETNCLDDKQGSMTLAEVRFPYMNDPAKLSCNYEFKSDGLHAQIFEEGELTEKIHIPLEKIANVQKLAIEFRIPESVGLRWWQMPADFSTHIYGLYELPNWQPGKFWLRWTCGTWAVKGSPEKSTFVKLISDSFESFSQQEIAELAAQAQL